MLDTPKNPDSFPTPFGLEVRTELFKGVEVYFSGSIKGDLPNKEIGFELVRYIIENGGVVSSAHVAARTAEEMFQTFVLMSGRGRGEDGKDSRDADMAYEVDMGWVDSATHLVAVIDGPSHGVGMEIMRALLKPVRGLNKTPIICFVHKDKFDKVSWMIKGANSEFPGVIQLIPYTSTQDAINKLANILTNSKDPEEA